MEGQQFENGYKIRKLRAVYLQKYSDLILRYADLLIAVFLPWHVSSSGESSWSFPGVEYYEESAIRDLDEELSNGGAILWL